MNATATATQHPATEAVAAALVDLLSDDTALAALGALAPHIEWAPLNEAMFDWSDAARHTAVMNGGLRGQLARYATELLDATQAIVDAASLTDMGPAEWGAKFAADDEGHGPTSWAACVQLAAEMRDEALGAISRVLGA